MQRPGARRVGRIEVRVAVGQEEQVAPRLGAVAEAVGVQVPEPHRHPPERHAREPGEERDRPEDPYARRGGPSPVVVALAPGRGVRAAGIGGEKRPGQDERGNGERQPEERDEPPLRRGAVDLEVDRVALGAREQRIRVRREQQVGEQMRQVAHVGGSEVVQDVGRASRDQRRQPVDDRDDDHQHRPERGPEVVRQRQEQPEEDGEAGAFQVVVDDDPDRVRLDHAPGLCGTDRRCYARRTMNTSFGRGPEDAWRTGSSNKHG